MGAHYRLWERVEGEDEKEENEEKELLAENNKEALSNYEHAIKVIGNYLNDNELSSAVDIAVIHYEIGELYG
ncbi:unnamed protein product, partial [Didymodactylos carnosus]